MRRFIDPTNERAERLREARIELHELYKAKQTGELTAQQERRIDQLSAQINEILSHMPGVTE